MWGRSVRGNNAPYSALLGCQSLPLLPTSKLGPSGADSQVGGFVYILGSCGSLQQILLWGWECLPPLQPPQVFTARGFEAFFFQTGTLSWEVCVAPQPCLMYSPPQVPVSALPISLNECFLFNSLKLDFHTVRFSSSSVYFLFLNLLLSFWLCEEAKCIYLYASILAGSSIFSFTYNKIHSIGGRGLWVLTNA